MNAGVLGFITAFFVVLLATPSLIKVAKLKHLVDEPSEERKLHNRSVPTIGGIMIYAAFLFSYTLWFPNAYSYSKIETLDDFKYILASMVLLFFIGVKDDIIGTAPMKKLIGHILVGFILVVMAKIRITSMYGLFGVYDLPEWASILLSIYVYIVIVNAYNLIDGIDGLAAGIGLINCLIFGFWFHFQAELALSLLAFSLGGALFGFLIFNYSPARIFMGDSGSLIIGMIISVLAIKLIESDPTSVHPQLSGFSTPILALCILVYPLLDTIRVFVIRAMKGLSPFTADRNHIHHRLIDLGWSHGKTVVWLYFTNIVIVSLAMLYQLTDPNLNLLVFVTIAFVLIQLPVFVSRKVKKEVPGVEV